MAVYTTVEDVVNKMTSSMRGKIRFPSNCVESVSVQSNYDSKSPGRGAPNYDLLFRYKNIVVDDAFSDSITIRFVFTSPTEYNVFIIDGVDMRHLFIGTGIIGVQFQTPDTLLSFPSTCWGGTIVAGNFVDVKFNCHISNETVEDYILEAQAMIDGMLSNGSIGYEIRGHVDTYFLAPDVPDLIKICCVNLTAYYIYTDLFYDKEVEANVNKSVSRISQRWLGKSNEALQHYISGAKVNVNPKSYNFPAKIDRVGVNGMLKPIPGQRPVSGVYADQSADAYSDLVFALGEYDDPEIDGGKDF